MWHSSRANTQLAEEPVELDSAWFSQCGHVRWELTSTQAAGWLGNLAHLPGPLQHHFHHLFLPSIVAITCHRPIYATWSRDPYLQLPASNVLALSVMWWHQPFVVNKYFPRVLKHLSSHLCSSLLFNHTLSYILAKTMCTPSGKEPSRLLWSEACLQVANVRVQTPRLAVCTPKDSMQSTSFHFVTVLAHEWNSLNFSARHTRTQLAGYWPLLSCLLSMSATHFRNWQHWLCWWMYRLLQPYQTAMEQSRTANIQLKGWA